MSRTKKILFGISIVIVAAAGSYLLLVELKYKREMLIEEICSERITEQTGLKVSETDPVKYKQYTDLLLTCLDNGGPQ
jgi:hypothetical protein